MNEHFTGTGKGSNSHYYVQKNDFQSRKYFQCNELLAITSAPPLLITGSTTTTHFIRYPEVDHHSSVGGSH